MKFNRSEIRHSDPVKEILGNPPKAIIRLGTSSIFVVFSVILLFSWIIKYPDRIPAPVEITTENPPVAMVSKITGRIKDLYVTDGEIVKSGRLLALMETTAEISDINRLKAIIDTIINPELFPSSMADMFAELGELQVHWSRYRKTLSDYDTYIRNDLYGSKINSMIREVSELEGYISRIIVKERLFTENQRIEVRKYRRDSVLFTAGVVSESDHEKSYQTLLRGNIELQQVRLDHSQKLIELAEKRQILQDYRIRRDEEREKLYSELKESYLNLKAQLSLWENTYEIISPVDGMVTFTRYWSRNQAVVKDEIVLSIVPSETGDFVGRIQLKMNRSGKVKEGQIVNIKLSGFPYLEFGMVRAVIRSKSLVTAGDAYIIELSFPEGLTTLYGRKLDFTQNMQGTAEIITEDLRLLQKIINPLRYLISKNRI